mmetsp:Transcript_58155/g.151143  ORF Transcript_58155/g.151143 Transcript_58155/m.151143 type:complete len:210 (-) Transcript_58155:89-718(-)
MQSDSSSSVLAGNLAVVLSTWLCGRPGSIATEKPFSKCWLSLLSGVRPKRTTPFTPPLALVMRTALDPFVTAKASGLFAVNTPSTTVQHAVPHWLSSIRSNTSSHSWRSLAAARSESSTGSSTCGTHGASTALETTASKLKPSSWNQPCILTLRESVPPRRWRGSAISSPLTKLLAPSGVSGGSLGSGALCWPSRMACRRWPSSSSSPQ